MYWKCDSCLDGFKSQNEFYSAAQSIEGDIGYFPVSIGCVNLNEITTSDIIYEMEELEDRYCLFYPDAYLCDEDYQAINELTDLDDQYCYT